MSGISFTYFLRNNIIFPAGHCDVLGCQLDNLVIAYCECIQIVLKRVIVKDFTSSNTSQWARNSSLATWLCNETIDSEALMGLNR